MFADCVVKTPDDTQARIPIFAGIMSKTTLRSNFITLQDTGEIIYLQTVGNTSVQHTEETPCLQTVDEAFFRGQVSLHIRGHTGNVWIECQQDYCQISEIITHDRTYLKANV